MKRAAVVGTTILAVLALAYVARRHRADNQVYEFAVLEPRYSAGGLYSVRDERRYKVVKILVVEPEIVHLRIYKNLFSVRPTQIDQSALSLGTINDSDDFGVGHLPISRREFLSWQPELIMQTSVTPDELEGYEEWKKARGGVFGK
jgi:hypothetical protein